MGELDTVIFIQDKLYNYIFMFTITLTSIIIVFRTLYDLFDNVLSL